MRVVNGGKIANIGFTENKSVPKFEKK